MDFDFDYGNYGFTIEYRSAIVDECDDVMYWCDELSSADEREILESHPEWHTKCIAF